MSEKAGNDLFASPHKQRIATDYTSVMLAEWRRRVQAGEYLEDWKRIEKRKKNFLTVPRDSEKYKYKGPHLDANSKPVNSSIPVPGKMDINAAPTISQQMEVYDAAFWSLMKADSQNPVEKEDVKEIKDRLKELLLFYATTPGLDFKNRVRWDGKFKDLPPGFIIALWVHQMEDVFQVCKSVFSPDETVTFINWVYEAASFSFDLLRNNLSRLFINRDRGDYSPNKNYAYGDPITMYHGSIATYSVNRSYNNRRLAHLPLLAKAGAIQANQQNLGFSMPMEKNFRLEAERIYKEAIAFGLYPNGECVEMERNEESKPSQGMGYSFMMLNAIAWVPYYRLLEGDDSLYFYKTSAGILGSEDPSTKTPLILESIGKKPKSLSKAIQYQFDCIGQVNNLYSIKKEENFKSVNRDLFRYNGLGQKNKPEWKAGHALLVLQANLGLKSASIRKGCENPFEAHGKAALISNKQSFTKEYAGSGSFRPSEGFFGLESCCILKYYGLEAFV